MQVSVEAPNSLERRVTVIVPFDKFEQSYNKWISNLAKTVQVKGFRKGKVPLDYVKQCYGEEAQKKALSELIQTSFASAFKQENLHPVDVPAVEPKTIIPGQPLEFVATFEVMPEIHAVQFSTTTMEKYVSTITQTDIENVFQQLRQQRVTWQRVNRPAQDKDQVVIDFLGSIDGKPFDNGKASAYPIVIGSKTMIPGFEEGLIGLDVNDEKILSLQFPDNYFSQDFSGKQAEFSVKVIAISEPVLPEINDVFIKKMGVKSGDKHDFTSEIQKNLEREMTRLMKAKMKKQVFDLLLEQNAFEIPKSLIHREAKRIHDELHPHHAGKEHGHSDAEMASFDEAAKRNVALGLIVAKLIKQCDIIPNGERVQAQIEQQASIYENPKEVLNWFQTNKKARADIEMQVLEDQVIEKLIENIQITEKNVTYSELIDSVKASTTI